LIVRETHYSTW